MTTITKNPDYKSLLDSVSTLIEEARRKAVKQVNTIIVQTYWEIGRLIVEEEQKGKERAEYGERVLKRLTNDLTKKELEAEIQKEAARLSLIKSEKSVNEILEKEK